MIYQLADNQFVGFSKAAGDVVTRSVQVEPGNGLLLCVTVMQYAAGASPISLAGLQSGNDGEQWTTDLVNFVTVTGVGYFELKFDSLAARFVRATYITNADAAMIASVSVETVRL